MLLAPVVTGLMSNSDNERTRLNSEDSSIIDSSIDESINKYFEIETSSAQNLFKQDSENLAFSDQWSMK
jgi:hypothetical protein